jgi:hypothetical protein
METPRGFCKTAFDTHSMELTSLAFLTYVLFSSLATTGNEFSINSLGVQTGGLWQASETVDEAYSTVPNSF